MVRLPRIHSGYYVNYYYLWSIGEADVNCIDFVPSHSLHIRGISLHRSGYGSYQHYYGLVRLKEYSTRTVITSQSFSFTTDSTRSYHDLLFTQPGYVEAGTKYTITLGYYGTWWRYIQCGSGGVARATAECNGQTVTMLFSNSSDLKGRSHNRSDISWGQFPRILFYC